MHSQRNGNTKTMARNRKQRSVSLIEVTVALFVGATVTGGIAPSTWRFLGKHKVERAELEMAEIRNAVVAFQERTGRVGFATNGAVAEGDSESVALLVGDGGTPEASDGDSEPWTRRVDYGRVDFLSNHLIENSPGAKTANAYSVWAGTYRRSTLSPDPWGNRYMVNVRHLSEQNGCDVVVLSAGPDGKVDTAFSTGNVVAGGDDLICVVPTETAVLTPLAFAGQ